MSNAVLPSYVGFKLEADKSPTWGTRIARARTGLERRVQEQIFPTWSIDLSVEVLRDAVGLDEAKTLIGFFNSRAGAFDSFLYTDPDDNAVTDQLFGVRDGATTAYQLIRTYGAFAEPVQNVNVLTNIKSNGVALVNPTDYTISTTGLVTLAVAGTAGHALTWTGSYYWRVRFDNDKLTFKKMFTSLWQLAKLPLIGSVANKV